MNATLHHFNNQTLQIGSVPIAALCKETIQKAAAQWIATENRTKGITLELTDIVYHNNKADALSHEAFHGWIERNQDYLVEQTPPGKILCFTHWCRKVYTGQIKLGKELK
jgi:hypothetical protein